MSVIHGGFSPSPTNPPQTRQTLKNGQRKVSSYRSWGHWPEWSYQWRSQSQANWRICGNISSRQATSSYMKNYLLGLTSYITIPWNSNKMSALGISCLTQDNLAHKKTSHKQTLGTGAAIPKKGISSGNCLWNICQILPKSNTKRGKRPESE